MATFTGAQLITAMLERHGVPCVTGQAAESVRPLHRALAASEVQHVRARQDRGAAHIACGMALASGRLAACVAAGAAELVGALADAQDRALPLLAICGSAAPSARTGYLADRLTKVHFLAREPADLAELLGECLRIAAQAVPGPVLLEVPAEVLRQRVEVDAAHLAIAPWAAAPRLGDAPAIDGASRGTRALLAALERRAGRGAFWVREDAAALPLAIGAALAQPARTTVLVGGEEMILAHVQELATLAEQQPNLRIALAADARSTIDLAAIARGFRLPVVEAEDPSEVDGAVERLFALAGPAILRADLSARRRARVAIGPATAAYGVLA